ncbi:MAG: glucose 1-dehydrogenase [Polyangia bacterium]
MRALVTVPSVKDSASLRDVPEPPALDGDLLVSMLAAGICGTDREIIAGKYGQAPPGAEYLILGHESLGYVLEAPPDSGFGSGDLVVGIVRHPDPVPCPSCAVGEWDMCRNGRYTEHGIKGRNGFAAERYRLQSGHAIKLDPRLAEVGVLLEPTSVVAKAWEYALRIARRAAFTPQRALITGAGPIGLLGALLGVQQGLDVHVLDRRKDGLKPRLVRSLGCTYHEDPESVQPLANTFDVILECTGVPALVLDVMKWVGAGGVVALAGLSSGSHCIPVNLGALNRDLVLENNAVFGSVNANRRHYEQAAAALLRAELEQPGWCHKLLTRRVPLSRWQAVLEKAEDDVKVVLQGAESGAG